LAPIYGVGVGPFGSITDFNTVTNRIGRPPNEYILAPEGYTPKAQAHEAPIYDISADKLEGLLSKVVQRQSRVTYVASDESTRRKEFIQRSLIFRFPGVRIDSFCFFFF
jgi:hypothetical protein